MPAQRAPLSDWQLTVLRWIANGQPDGVMTGFTYKTTAVALQNRHLVVVSRRGGTWSAELTGAGRRYLDHGRYPDPEARDQPQRKTKPAPPVTPAPSGNGQSTAKRTPARQQSSRAAAAMKRKGPAEQLVEAVVAAGGCLTVDRSETPDYVYYQRITAAERYGKVPEGKRLTARVLTWPGMEIRLDDRPATIVAPPQGPAASVPVPERVARYHPVTARFREEKERHEVSAAALSRALRIVQALVVEAEYGTYTAWSGSRDGHISIRVRSHSTALRVHEEGLPSRTHWQRTHWGSKDKYPTIGSGQLKIELCGYSSGNRQSHWADRKKWSLEDKIPDILREIEIQADERDAAQLAREQAAAERRRRWEAAIEAAKVSLTEAHRARHLRAQAHQWREIHELRAYLDAMRHAAGAITDPEKATAAGDWIAWAEHHLETTDPLAALATPDPPEATPDALKPFLQGWSPYGPDGRS